MARKTTTSTTRSDSLSLVELIAWCKKRKDARHQFIALYLETYRRITDTTFRDTLQRSEKMHTLRSKKGRR